MTQTHVTDPANGDDMDVETPAPTAFRGYIENPRQGSPGSWNQVDVSIAGRERDTRTRTGGRVERSRRHHKSIPVTKGSWDREQTQECLTFPSHVSPSIMLKSSVRPDRRD